MVAGMFVCWGIIELVLAHSRFWAQSEEILQFNNLLLLYSAVFLSHFMHELGHAVVSKHFGGAVRTMGIMLLLLTPLPYVDLSASWTFRERHARVLVDLAGMLTDLVTGAVATLVWVYSPPGTINELAYNLIFAVWVHTFIFNINPLMRFDGYYALSDWLEIPNLHEQAKQAFRRFWSRSVLGEVRPTHAGPPGSGGGLIVFYLSSNLYRLMVMFGIIVFIADQYFGIGLVVAGALLLTSFWMPMRQILTPLKNPLFVFQHRRVLRIGAALLSGLLVVLLFVPVPDSRVVHGVVEATANTPVHAASSGLVEQVLVHPGAWVEVDTPLMVLVNPELELEREGVMAQQRQAAFQEGKALTEGGADLEPIRERQHSLETARLSLERQMAGLTVTAPHAGIWIPGDAIHWRASWVGRGMELGRVVDDRRHHFAGVIRQEAALALVELRPEASRVRIEGERHLEFVLDQVQLVPHSQAILPSAVLSPVLGGEMPVKKGDGAGRQAVEPFFLLRADLVEPMDRPQIAPPRGGRAGWMRVVLPERPLAEQFWRAARQFVQRRYGL